jgi:DNA-binding Lrp family transcriptional regulator
MLLNNDKSYAEKLRQDEVTPKILNKPKKLSNEVIEMIRALKDDGKVIENLYENNILKFDGVTFDEEIIIRFKNYIKENRNGEKLPSPRDIENEFGIKEKQRLKIMNKLVEDGFLIKKNERTYIYNVNISEEVAL